MKKFDITALGEILIDFTYAGVTESGTTLFEQNPGGAPANVLAAVQKLGGKSAFIGKVGNDMHGNFLKSTLEENEINTDGLIVDDKYFTTLAFVDLTPSGERSFSFARKPGADTQLTKDEVNYDIIKSSKIFHVGSLSLTDEPARTATISALKYAKENNVIVSYDPNYRDKLWKNEKAASDGMKSILEYVDIIKISDEEINLITDADSYQSAAAELIEKGISCVIVTLGSKGAYVATAASSVISPCPEIKVVDTTGAGDSFMGGFLYKMAENNKNPSNLTADEIKEFSDFANVVATLCVSRRGAINAMPTMSEVLNFH